LVSTEQVSDVQDPAVHVRHADPASYKEAMRMDDAPQFSQAMQKEWDDLNTNGTWKLVHPSEIPAGKNILPSKWVLSRKYKDNELHRHKARLVVMGNKQRHGFDYDETFSPTTRWETIRVILALAAYHDYDIDQYDFEQAFVNAEIDGDIFVRMPDGFKQYADDGKELVMKLVMALYGAKQAGRLWNKKLHRDLTTMGYKQSQSDPGLYVRVNEKGEVSIIPTYVDDFLATGNDVPQNQDTIKTLKHKYRMKELGPVSEYVGMRITRDRPMRTLKIDLENYILRFLEEFGMSKCNPASTPADSNILLSQADCPSTEEGKTEMQQYRSLYAKGTAMAQWICIVCRPDIACIVSQLASFTTNPGMPHWFAFKRLMRYLRGTPCLGLLFDGHSKDGIVPKGFVDSDYANDIDDRRSRSGHAIIMAGAAVSYRSNKQPTVATSSTQAEYQAAYPCIQEVVFLRRLLQDLNEPQLKATAIYEDNEGCIALAKNPVHHKRSKHIDVKYHFTREKVESGEVELFSIRTDEQVADVLTKNLPKAQFLKFRALMLGEESSV
jgi:hypothetical protein